MRTLPFRAPSSDAKAQVESGSSSSSSDSGGGGGGGSGSISRRMPASASSASLQGKMGGRISLLMMRGSSAAASAFSSSHKPKSLPWAVPERHDLDLVFFKNVFYRLRRSLGFQDHTLGDIPLLSFQRAMGRLFRVLQIDRPFDAKKYDLNGDGSVGWWEFCKLWKEEFSPQNPDSLAIRLSVAERIYITFEEPNSSRLGRIASTVVLLAIGVSAGTFIISTMPVMQEAKCGNCMPEPFKIFNTLDIACVILFTIEYITRFVTAAFTRIELINHEDIISAMCEDECIQWPTRCQRLSAFFWALPNMIDLAAILPSFVTWALDAAKDPNVEEEGGPNFVFQLIKLMRMVRAFRLGRKFEAVRIISGAMRKSDRALSVLVLNMILGMLIFGSIMFFIEGGDYDPKDGGFKRPWKWEWSESSQSFIQSSQRSPFTSIPECFWWVVVTCTTVGYGDYFPTTTAGKIAASVAMVWSLCVLALPVSIIGGNFAKVWMEYDKEKQDEDQLRKNQSKFIKTAMSQIEPISVSKFLHIAVYHNSNIPAGNPCRENDIFIGEAESSLELDPFHPVIKQLRLPLQENRGKADRGVSGTVFIDYEWTPARPLEEEDEALLEGNKNKTLLRGNLALTVARAKDLAPIDWSSPVDGLPKHLHGLADPYVEVTVYPQALGKDLTSGVNSGSDIESTMCWLQKTWCSETVKNVSAEPVWNETKEFGFHWDQDGVDALQTHQKKQYRRERGDTQSTETMLPPDVQQMREELRQLKQEVLPELSREVNGLKAATREILEMLRPPAELDLPNTTTPSEAASSPRAECALPELPSLPSQTSERQQEPTAAWGNAGPSHSANSRSASASTSSKEHARNSAFIHEAEALFHPVNPSSSPAPLPGAVPSLDDANNLEETLTTAFSAQPAETGLR